MVDPARFGQRRRVAGIMSGTSVDGIDVAVCTLEGSGRQLVIRDIEHLHCSYDPLLRQVVLENSNPEASSVVAISQLNVRLAHAFAEALDSWISGGETASLDLIGCHGQTVYHVPDETNCGGRPTRSTLQLGDGATLAALTGVPVVSDFRLADMAFGGQGAPLVPYFDAAVLRAPDENRLALNLGGIANFTVLPAELPAELPAGLPAGVRQPVTAFDTGPANMLLDELASRLLNEPFDRDGTMAAQGQPDEDALAILLADEYFHRPPPKSTGREYFGSDYVDRLLDLVAGSDGEIDGKRMATVFATAAELTVRSIADAVDQFVTGAPIDRVIVSGGGTRNRYLMQRLGELLAPAAVELIDDHGIPAEAKEALCFAVLAHEFINGVPTGLPSVTGATRPAMLGKLSLA